MITYIVRRVDLSHPKAPSSDSELLTKFGAQEMIKEHRKLRAKEGMHIVHGIVEVLS